MNILIACDSYPPDVNGAATFTQQLVIGLLNRNHRVTVLLPSRSLHTHAFSEKDIHYKAVSSIPLPIASRFRIVPPGIAYYQAKKVIKQTNPDVLHAQSYYTLSRAAIKAAYRLGKPIVGTNHLMPENIVHYFHLPPSLEKRAIQRSWNQFKHTYRQVDTVTAPTETAANLLRNTGLESAVQAISNGIDLKKFTPQASHTSIRSRFNIPTDRPIFLTVCRLDPEKRLSHLVEAFALCLQQKPAHLVICGKGQELVPLKTLVKKLNLESSVTFTGFVADSELPSLYQGADVFVMAGIAELQSIATMEAMASGLPIIAANALALPELVQHEHNGFLFEKNDIQKLSELMLILATDTELRQRFGANSRIKILPHNIENVIDQFESKYLSALNKK